MISLILPYWDRREATDTAMHMLAQRYSDLDLEVILVDDGNKERYVPRETGIDIQVFEMPLKDGPKDSCLCYNEGVKASKGDYIALSSPEMLHTEPILQDMLTECEFGGRNAYVIAACYCPEQGRWHEHSSRKRSNDDDVGAFLPDGAGYHFMTMLHRDLWDHAGGFDPDYRDGAGYEDPDFVMRLAKANAKFVRRDDLIVLHPRANARTQWQPGQFERNRAIFMSKWALPKAA